MSDESKPPPLRLKPRLRPGEPAPPRPEAPAESQEATPTLRLKPRLAPEPAPQPAPGESLANAEAPSPASAFSPAPDVPSASSGEEAPPRFKLKAKSPTPAETTAESRSVEPPPPAMKSPPEPSPPPEEPPPPSASDTLPLAAPVMHLKAPGDMDEGKLAVKAARAVVRKKPLRKLLGSVLGAVVLLGAAYMAWQKLTALPPPPVLNPRPVMAKPKAPAAPTGALDKIPALPGGRVEHAPDAIVHHRENERERVDGLAAGRNLSEPGNPVPSAPIEPTTVEARSRSVIAPGVTATITTTMTAAAASRAFKSFVASLTINGVFQGTPSRALINGHTFREGELIEPNLGIVFDHVDAARNQVVFKDLTGAIVERGY